MAKTKHIMAPIDFKKWRKSLKLSQKEAAHALGLKRRMIQYYEKGERDDEIVIIPLNIRLACWAISQNVADFTAIDQEIVPFDRDGFKDKLKKEESDAEKKKKKKKK